MQLSPSDGKVILFSTVLRGDLIKTQPLRKPDTDTDLLRILAAFGVVMIHVSDTAAFSGLFLNAVSRFSVPVFVIISGYYMLAHKPDTRRLAGKCARLFCLMLLWSGIYFGYDLLCGVGRFTGVGALLTYLLTEPVHLWYLYAIIALYLFTPLLYIFTHNATQGEYRYALALTFLFGSPVVILLRSGWVPVLAVILDKMKVPYLLGMPFLYLLGGYLRKYGVTSPAHRRAVCFLGLAGAAVSVGGTALLKADGGDGSLLLSFFAPNVIAEGAAVFLFCKHFLNKHPISSDSARTAIRLLSQNTLGIYLLHPLIMRLLPVIPVPGSSGLTTVLRAVLVFAVSAVIVTCLRLVPGLRRTC